MGVRFSFVQWHCLFSGRMRLLLFAVALPILAYWHYTVYEKGEEKATEEQAGQWLGKSGLMSWATPFWEGNPKGGS